MKESIILRVDVHDKEGFLISHGMQNNRRILADEKALHDLMNQLWDLGWWESKGTFVESIKEMADKWE